MPRAHVGTTVARRLGETVEKRIAWFAPLVLILVTLVTYLGAARNGRLPEDEQVVWRNQAVVGQSTVEAWRGRYYDATNELNPVVRPLATTIFRLEHAAFTFDRGPFQWTLLLLHAAAAVMFYYALRRLLHRSAPALVGAVLFAVHPCATQSVLRLAGQSDILSLLFTLTSMFAALRAGELAQRGRAGRAEQAWIVGLYLAACMCKEWAVAAAPAIWLCYATRASSAADQRSGSRILGYGIGAVVLVTVLVRFLSLAALPEPLQHVTTVTPVTGLSFPKRVLFGLSAIPTYLRLTVLPLQLGYSYDYLLTNHGLGLWIRFLVGALVLGGLGIGCYRSVKRREETAAVWALALLGLIAALGIIVPVGDVASERMLYPLLPAAITLVLIAYGTAREALGNVHWDRAAFAVCIVIAAAFGARAASRVRDFADWEHLVKAQCATYEKSAQGRFDLGNFYLEQGLWSGAGAEYDRALALRGDFWQAWINRGGAYFGANEIGLAMRCYQTALVGLEGKPAFLSVWGKLQFNRAIILMQQDRNQEAVRALNETTRVYPNHLRAQASLGYIYANAPAYDREAIEHLTRAIALESDPERGGRLRAKLDEIKRRRANINSRRGYPADFIAGGGVESPDGATGGGAGSDEDAVPPESMPPDSSH